MVLKHTNQPVALPPWFRSVARLRLVMIGLLICIACQPETSRKAESTFTGTTRIQFMGFTLPVYPTAAEQLVYAKSRIADLREKKAALKLVLSRFPQDTHACALARLDLAYLALGADYRLADRNVCQQALNQYRQITRTYAALPEMCAKAYWYMGWIYTDLLGDEHNGMAMYQQVISRYASERMAIESPISWLKLMHPEKKPGNVFSTHEQRHYSWAALSLLEIAKKSKDPIQRRQALVKLWTLKPTGTATGLALLSVLKSGYFNTDDRVQHIAQAYIQKNIANHLMVQDIKAVFSQSTLEHITK